MAPTSRWRSKDLEIAYIRAADVPDIVRMLRSDSVRRYLYFKSNTEAETRAYFEPKGEATEAALARGRLPPDHVFVMREPASGALIGECALELTPYASRTYALGYQLDEPFWGRGLATRAARFLVWYAVRRLDVRRLTADCYATNEASARILRGLGMREEGRLREQFVEDGVPVDNLLFGVLRRELDESQIDEWGAELRAD